MRAQCLIYSSVTRATHKRGEFEHRAACSCHLHPVWFIVALMIFSPWENAEPSLLVLISERGLDKITFFASFVHDVHNTNEALWSRSPMVFALTPTFYMTTFFNCRLQIKGVIQPKITVLSSFTHPNVTHMSYFLSSEKYNRRNLTVFPCNYNGVQS